MLKKTSTYAIRIGGVTLLALAAACAGDDAPSARPGPGLDSGGSPVVADAGVSDASLGGGFDAGACVTTLGRTGAACTMTSGTPGYRTCVNGVPTGECMSFVPEGGINAILGDAGIAAFLDSGLFGDSGLGGFGVVDGSITVGDATIALPEAGTLKCPTGYMCSTMLGAFFPGISACVKEGGDGLFPDTCTTPMAACKSGTANGTCQDVVIGKYCITPCN